MKIMRWLGISEKVYTKKLPGNILIHVKPEEHIQRQLFWYGRYEESLGFFLKKILQPDSVFIDIGANTGYFSLFAARLAPDGKIIAFEPVSCLYEELKKNITLNNFKNIETVKAAIGEKKEEKLIYISGSDNTGMSSFQKPENYAGENEMADVIAFDSWFKESKLSKADIMKLDVEGSELAALKGMRQTILQHQPLIVLESNPETLFTFGLNPGDILNFAEELSFKSFVITGKGDLKQIQSNDLKTTVNLVLIHKDKLSIVNHFLT